MFELAGYTVTAKIYEGPRTTVYRGYRTQDKHPVIIKCLQNQYPEPQQIAQFQHEHEIIKFLNAQGIIKNYGLQKHNNSWILIFEDIQGDSLKNLIADRKINLAT
ncbi:MAG: hypothetical protein BWK79_13325, partial [Beggiatoa sp. IS2]